MPLRPCLTCGKLGPGSYCARHAPVRSTPGRSARPQQRFREAVLDRAGHRCQWIEEGVRCQETEGLAAHHLEAFRATPSYRPEAGIALCLAHHREADRRLAEAHVRVA